MVWQKSFLHFLKVSPHNLILITKLLLLLFLPCSELLQVGEIRSIRTRKKEKIVLCSKFQTKFPNRFQDFFVIFLVQFQDMYKNCAHFIWIVTYIFFLSYIGLKMHQDKTTKKERKQQKNSSSFFAKNKKRNKTQRKQKRDKEN